MDAVTLDGLLGELAPRIEGRHLGRPRLVGSSAIELEVAAQREHRLWLDAHRGTAGLYWLPRELSRSLADLQPQPSGRARHALLSFRKHADGVRVHRIRRVGGDRCVAIEAGDVNLVLRLSGAAPSLTLVAGGRVVAVVGDGAEAWPIPADRPDHEWQHLSAEQLVEAVSRAEATGRSSVRAVLDLAPWLSPRLAREIGEDVRGVTELLSRLGAPRATLLAPCPPDEWVDSDLVGSSAVFLVPCSLRPIEGVVCPMGSWCTAAALFLEGRLRGAAFEARRRARLEGERRDARRLVQLLAHLAKDVGGLADEVALRRQGEAILAALADVPRGRDSAFLQDPKDPERRIDVTLDPRLAPAANADRLFERARRVDRARRAIASRMEEARARLQRTTEREEAILGARQLSDLLETAVPVEKQAARGATSRRAGREGRKGRKGHGPLHFLTSRGLSLLVGRSARANHELTFGVARPEDHWFHARDVPGAHVILRDREGRASAEDLKEAAEVAAHFSDARREGWVDVHCTRRKHLRPGRGGHGRVSIGHAETLRVSPRDPDGRLRRR